MKKEYLRPEAEMMKFAEVEEIMTGSIPGPGGILDPELGVKPWPGSN